MESEQKKASVPIIVQARKVALTPPLKRYAEKKFGRLDRYFKNIQKIEVHLEVRDMHDLDHCQTAEVTVWVSGNIIRAEVGTSDLYASIDMAFAKLEKQIVRYKDRLKTKDRRAIKRVLREGALDPTEDRVSAEEQLPRLIRTKRFAIKPMPPQEAAEQMDLLGHSFFVFQNSETAQVNVVYARKDGNVGLIEPSFA